MTAGDFLALMAAGSARRVAAARAAEPDEALAERAARQPPAPALRLDGRFDLVAELKLRSPAMGLLSADADLLEQRVSDYARAGAAIVSVLTEPDRFDGSLAHLERAVRALAPFGVPAMRKDFLTDPYQLLEARAAGAGGVLLIVRMLDDALLQQMLQQAVALGLFVLIETFDADEVGRATRAAARWSGPPSHCLIGVNSRNLSTLEVVPDRLQALASTLPLQYPRVAESGLRDAADAAQLAAAGYTLALVGTALMSSPDPVALGREMIGRGREASAS